MTYPKEAIEAAAMAIYRTNASDGSRFELDDYRPDAIAAIKAAGPILMAQAWDRCAASIVDEHGNPIIPDSNSNPYRSKI